MSGPWPSSPDAARPGGFLTNNSNIQTQGDGSFDAIKRTGHNSVEVIFYGKASAATEPERNKHIWRLARHFLSEPHSAKLGRAKPGGLLYNI